MASSSSSQEESSNIILNIEIPDFVMSDEVGCITLGTKVTGEQNSKRPLHPVPSDQHTVSSASGDRGVGRVVCQSSYPVSLCLRTTSSFSPLFTRIFADCVLTSTSASLAFSIQVSKSHTLFRPLALSGGPCRSINDLSDCILPSKF